MTDNAHLASKLALRRSFLRDHKPPKGQQLRVFDACQGSGVLWATLRREFDVRYWGVDMKPRPGRLKVDSARVLEVPGWHYDVVDVDTYGQPWRHWAAILRNGSGRMTVFLTLGEASGPRAPLNRDGLRALGLAKLDNVLPYGLKHQLSRFALDYLIAMGYPLGWKVERFAESTPGPRARYFGVHMTRTTRNG